MMRRLCFFVFFFWTSIASAQQLSSDMMKLESICLDLSTAVGHYGERNITDANEEYRQFRTKNAIGAMPVENLQEMEKDDINSQPQMVFLPEFFDKLVQGDNAYEFAMELRQRFEINKSEQKVVRGEKHRFKFYQKDFFIRPNETISFEISERPSPFEIIAVAGPGGLFNLDVYDILNQDSYNDTEKEKTGDVKRERCVSGPKNGRYRISLKNMVNGSYTIVLFCN